MSWGIVVLLIGGWGLTNWLHGGHHFPVLTWPAGLAVAAAFLLAATGQLRQPFRPSQTAALWGWLLLLGVALYAVGLWEWHQTPSDGFLPVVNWTVGVLAVGAVLWGLPGTSARLALALGIIVVAAVQYAQIGLWRTGSGALPNPWTVELLKVWYKDFLDLRMSGFFINRNHLAWLLNVACLLCASLCVWSRLPGGVKFFLGWIAALFALGPLLILSRGGTLGLAGGLLVFLLSSLFLLARARGRSRLGVLVLLGVLILGLCGATTYLIVTDSLVQERMERVKEDLYREQTWQSGWRQWQAHPWLGTGPGSATSYARILRPVGLTPNEALHLHNDWLELLAEGGIVALIATVLALGLFLLAGLASADRRLRARPSYGFPQSTEAALSLGAVSALGAMAVHSFFDFNLQLGANSLLAFFILGLAGAGGEKLPLPKLAGVGLFAIAAGAVAVFLWWSTPPWQADWRRVQMTNASLRGQPQWPPGYEPPTEPLGRGQDALWLTLGDYFSMVARQSRDPLEATEALARSIEYYTWATQRQPLDRLGWLRLAGQRAAAGGWFFAYKEALEGLARDPMSGFGYEVLGQIREINGDWDMARRAYLLSATQFRQSPFVQERLAFLQQQEQAGTIPPWSPLKIWQPATE